MCWIDEVKRKVNWDMKVNGDKDWVVHCVECNQHKKN
jgi:hypothetical protein